MIDHDFYSLDEATKLLECERIDLLKLGVTGKIDLLFWYEGKTKYERRDVKGLLSLRKEDIMPLCLYPKAFNPSSIYVDHFNGLYGAPDNTPVAIDQKVSVFAGQLFLSHETLAALKKEPKPTPNDEIADILNVNHPWHSELLSLAVKGWIELYSTREGNSSDNAYKPPGGHIAMIETWLNGQESPLLTKTSRGYLGKVINPSKGGGPNKTQE
jgi:hypothetical protein